MYVRLAALDTLKMLSCKSKVHEAVLVIAFQSFLQNKERYNNLTQLVNRKVRLKDLFPKSFIKPNLTLTSLLQNKGHYTKTYTACKQETAFEIPISSFDVPFSMS
jgi:hypothetical protein